MLRSLRSRNSGPHPKAFSIFELMFVVVTLGVLALIAIPTFGKVNKNYEISRKENFKIATRIMAEDYPSAKVLKAGPTSRVPGFRAEIDFGGDIKMCDFDRAALLSCEGGVPQR